MWFKIALPLALIAIIYWLGRRHGGRKEPDRLPPPPPPMSQKKRRFLLGFLVAGIGVIVGTAVDWWLDRHQVMLVRVIHTQSNHTTVYKAQRYLIHHRTFETVDGMKIILADAERMEMIPLD
ncbi:MAG: hypothetical protein G8345_18675 [Magnetococcales bacterium]|nr:hypothetical protein [Magnetococcales bacterium]NGZ28900.1 hypothetical protein [Magnetococcales bacterium]